MPEASRAFCSEVSQENAEPLAATASRVDHWILVEYRGLWSSDALAGSGLSDQVKRHLREQVSSVPHGRLLFVRRPDRRGAPRLLAFTAASRPGEIKIRVTNPQRDDITIATVAVDDAIVPYTLDGDRTIGRLRSTTVVIPFDWVDGEPLSVGVTSSTGIQTTKEVAAAVETPQASAKGFFGYAVIGFLVNPKDPTSEDATRDAQAAAETLGHKLVIVTASSASEIDPALAMLAQHHIAALFVNADPLYNVNSPRILALAARHKMPTISSWEGFAAEGGLISYGTSINEANLNWVSIQAGCSRAPSLPICP